MLKPRSFYLLLLFLYFQNLREKKDSNLLKTFDKRKILKGLKSRRCVSVREECGLYLPTVAKMYDLKFCDAFLLPKQRMPEFTVKAITL